jgi:hypothetical protein
MKKNFLAIIAILSALPFFSNAQTWSGSTPGDIYYNSGSVGIGTAGSPGTKFEVKGATTTTPTVFLRNSSYGSTDASGTSALGLYFANHGAVKIEASKYTTNISDLKFYGEYGYNIPSLIMTLHPTSASGGYVGIGTTNPIGNLDVRGNFFIGTTDFAIASTGSTIQIDQGANTGNTYSRIRAFSNGGAQVNNLVLQSDGGNVGVGTDNPISLFQVDDGCTKASIGDASGPALNYGTSYLGFNAARSGTSWTMHSDGVNNGGGVIYNDIFGNMNFATIASTASASNQVLSDATVKGNIYLQITKTGIVRVKAIKAETANWPDYVFKKEYKLPSLASVKAYIDKNQHLPEMPSEQDVAKNGIDLGEMVKLQTKKIEELTLYLLKENEAKQAQQKEINELRRQVETLLKKKP